MKKLNPGGCLPAGSEGSNPTGGISLCLLTVLCLVKVEVSATGRSLV